jgi:hypothetical protein
VYGNDIIAMIILFSSDIENECVRTM